VAIRSDPSPLVRIPWLDYHEDIGWYKHSNLFRYRVGDNDAVTYGQILFDDWWWGQSKLECLTMGKSTIFMCEIFHLWKHRAYSLINEQLSRTNTPAYFALLSVKKTKFMTDREGKIS
jgi:hypothetical protein